MMMALTLNTITSEEVYKYVLLYKINHAPSLSKDFMYLRFRTDERKLFPVGRSIRSNVLNPHTGVIQFSRFAN